MGNSVNQKALKIANDTILSPDWKKADIIHKNFKISTRIEKIFLFTSYVTFS